jgi:thioredoxin-like negative regulator of GroEL
MKKILLAFFTLLATTSPILAEDLIIFSANWCPSCVVLKNFIENNPQEIKYDYQIIDIDQNKDIKRKFNITKIPTSIIVSENGKEISRLIGYNSTTYKNWLKKYE